jgi:hypothetical protein
MMEHWRVDKVGFPLSGWLSRRFLCSSLDPECESLCYGGPGAVMPASTQVFTSCKTCHSSPKMGVPVVFQIVRLG